MSFPTYSLFGIRFTNINLQKLSHWVASGNFRREGGYICLPNSLVVTMAEKDEQVMKVLNTSTMTLPDGKPLAWAANFKGKKGVETISGYWLLKALMEEELTHYFYGVSEPTLEIIRQRLESEYPKAKIIGYKSPPFVKESEIEDNSLIARDIEAIAVHKPDLVWVGISSPKQDLLMYFYHKQLKGTLMIGVGAVFDYLAGTEKISPEWMKRMGLRWLYRLIQDPKRHFKKYLISGFRFLKLIISTTVNRKNEGIK